jgi:starch-binding outer membrane protein, SusD/RagB family
MRTHRLSLIVPLVLTLPAAACMDNSLDITNPNQRTEEVFWASEADAIAGMNSVYRTLYNDGTYGRNRQFVWGRTDTYTSRSPATNILNFPKSVVNSLTDGFLNGYWEDPYRGIFRANQVIHNVPDIAMTVATRDRIVAEARFIRALYHYEQALLFGDVPIITDVATLEDKPEYKPRADVWKFVSDEALAAAPALEWRYTGANIGRVTRGGALALAADALMMQKKWTEAAAALQQIVASGQYSLLADYSRLFVLPDGENSAESLFEVQFGDNAMAVQGARGNINPRLVGPQGLGFSDMQPTEWAFQQFFADGPGWPNNPDPRLDWTIVWNKPGGMDVWGQQFATRYPNGFRETDVNHTYFWKKYQEYWRTAAPPDFDNPINLKVYRYGVALLMLADALNEAGQPAAAAAEVNKVRTRARATLIPTNLTQAEMRDRINREFVLEATWEGSTRLAYLVRHDYLNKAYLTARNPVHGATFVNGKSEFLPKPQREIDRNPNGRQNPGW